MHALLRLRFRSAFSDLSSSGGDSSSCLTSSRVLGGFLRNFDFVFASNRLSAVSQSCCKFGLSVFAIEKIFSHHDLIFQFAAVYCDDSNSADSQCREDEALLHLGPGKASTLAVGGSLDRRGCTRAKMVLHDND